MADRQKPKAAKKRIAVPHTHLSLAALGAFRDSFPHAGEYDPTGNYRATWRLLFADGYTPLEVIPLGFLHLERKTLPGGNTFSLTVDRCMQNPDEELHHLHMNIVCRHDALATPLEGSLTSRFTSANGSIIPELSQDERFALKEGVLEHQHGASTFKETAPKAPAHAWGLFEATARLPFTVSEPRSFALLEGTDVLKPAQTISYVGSEAADGGDGRHVHAFAQVGSGIVPTEYFLDDAHRLLSVITSARVYVREELMSSPMTGAVKAAFERGNFQ